MASNNGTFLEELEILYHGCDVPFHHAEMRIMCFAHLINICCQHIIRSLMNLDLQDDNTADNLLSNASVIQAAGSNVRSQRLVNLCAQCVRRISARRRSSRSLATVTNMVGSGLLMAR
jgi:hypothetical protein